MGTDRSPAAAVVGQVGIRPPVGQGRKTTIPSWMRARVGGSTLAIRDLRRHSPRGAPQEGERVSVSAVTHPVPRGTQKGNGRVPATAATHPAAVPPPKGREQQTTPQVRMSTGTASLAIEPGGPQQQAPGG